MTASGGIQSGGFQNRRKKFLCNPPVPLGIGVRVSPAEDVLSLPKRFRERDDGIVALAGKTAKDAGRIAGRIMDEQGEFSYSFLKLSQWYINYNPL